MIPQGTTFLACKRFTRGMLLAYVRSSQSTVGRMKSELVPTGPTPLGSLLQIPVRRRLRAGEVTYNPVSPELSRSQ
jgi:hypothetical protein